MKNSNIQIFGLVIASLIFTQGCAKQQETTVRNGTSCTVLPSIGGSVITCTDGTSSFVPNGTNGTSVGFVTIAASNTQCPAGGYVNTFYKDSNNNGSLDSGEQVLAVQTICNGTNGTNGLSSAMKTTAADHSACANGGTVISLGKDLNNNGVLDSAEVTDSAVVCNGANGTNGTNAPVAQFQPVLPITPCGADSSQYKEVLLGMSGGSILSEFSESATNANLVRNTFIPDGSYYDTDNSECDFTVSSSANGNKVVSWSGSSHNGSGPYRAGQATYTASTMSWAMTY